MLQAAFTHEEHGLFMATPRHSTLELSVGSDTESLRHAGDEHVWLHASPWRALLSEEGKRILVEGHGCIVKDVDGKEYIDGLAGLWLVNVGHGRKEIGEAMATQAGTLAYASSTQATTVPAIQLATLLSEITPGDLSTVFFCSGGSEAVESAIKIARQYHHLTGAPKRFKIIGRRGSYHGATFGAMSVSGTRQMSEPFYSPFMQGTMHVSPPYCYRCDYRHTYPACDVYCVDAIEQMIQFEGPETVAAVIAEPVSASGGIVIPPPEYLPRLREICDRHGVLLIVDEVINGFGRTGKMFASEHWDLVGDIMTVAKGLSSGYAPIAAAICRPKVVEPFASDKGKKLAHLLTFGGQAVACTAALANIAIIQGEKLVENAAAMGTYLLEQLRSLQHHPTVGDIRGIGLLVAVELVKDRDSKEKFAMDGEEVKTLGTLLIDRGLLTRVTHIILLSPPLCITPAEVDRMVEIIDRSITAFEQQYGYH
jgi:adenosylmethionine-8-amino-7-oxononanoate aminotransferase